MKIKIELNLREAKALKAHLASLIGKGSISTTPSWARSLIGKISREIEGN